MTILISNEVDFREKKVARSKERHHIQRIHPPGRQNDPKYVLIKQQSLKDTKENWAPERHKRKLGELKGETEKSAVLVGDISL